MMTLAETTLDRDVQLGSTDQLRVERTKISFLDLAGDKVRITVTVHNDGDTRSRPTFMVLQSAPLGAFVSWQPLAFLPVPPIAASASQNFSVDADRPHPTPLGSFDRIPPRRLLTALDLPDDSTPNRGVGLAAVMMKLLRRRRDGKTASLAPDLWDWVGRDQPHWAGNINVFVGSKAVERHVAKALRIYPGRTNFAMFIVGERENRDSYSFEFVGLDPAWNAELFDLTNQQSLLVESSNSPIQEAKWVEACGSLMVMLATRPPADCEEGNIEIHVTRLSTQTAAIVEFNLDPAAQGAGCYVA